MDATIAAANTGLANLLDPLFEGGLSGATRPVMVSGSVEQKHVTGSPDRYIPVAAISSTSLRFRTSFKALDTARPQRLLVQAQISHHLTQLVVLVLELLQPPHLARQQPVIPLLPIEVGRLADPASRQISATAMPSAPSLKERLLHLRKPSSPPRPRQG